MEAALRAEIAAQAAAWFSRLQSPSVTREERAEFSLWMLRSPEHVREYLLVVHTWSELQHADRDKFSTENLIAEALMDARPENVRSLPSRKGLIPVTSSFEPAGGRGARLSKQPKFWLAAAALAMLACATAFWFARGGSSPVLTTAVGEQRSITLADGSLVHLNTDSEVRIELTPAQRKIELLRGEARFTVAKDAARPFVVAVNGANVKALGTVFNIRMSADETAVAVLEGRVEMSVRETQSRLELAAGQRAAINDMGRILPEVGPSLQRVNDWSERRLIFREETLSSVIEEVNRYHTDHVVIADPALANLRISGAFSANDLSSLIEYLERYHGVYAHRDAKGEHVLNF